MKKSELTSLLHRYVAGDDIEWFSKEDLPQTSPCSPDAFINHRRDWTDADYKREASAVLLDAAKQKTPYAESLSWISATMPKPCLFLGGSYD